jgi:hypothetical protein
LVVFVGSDQKEYTSPIGPDGSYKVISVPKGEAQILVRGTGGSAQPPKVGKTDVKSDLGAGTGGGGVAPPKKYSLPNNGLKVNVAGGDQKHDIELKP